MVRVRKGSTLELNDKEDDAGIWARDKYGNRKPSFTHIGVPESTAKKDDDLRNELECVYRRVAYMCPELLGGCLNEDRLTHV